MTEGVKLLALCRLDDLADGKARGFDPFDQGRDAIFIVRRGKRLKAYKNVCPHQGASLCWRKDAYLNATGKYIVCHAHGAQFEIDDGQCVVGPALGKKLEEIEVEIDEQGMIVVARANCKPMLLS